MIIRAAREDDIEWLAELLPFAPTKDCGGVVAEGDNGRMGMIALDCWTPRAVQAHITIINAKALAPLKREVLDYLWKHGRRLLYAVTPSENTRSLKLQLAVGMKERYRLKDAWDEGVDMVITELPIHGKESTEST